MGLVDAMAQRDAMTTCRLKRRSAAATEDLLRPNEQQSPRTLVRMEEQARVQCGEAVDPPHSEASSSGATQCSYAPGFCPLDK